MDIVKELEPWKHRIIMNMTKEWIAEFVTEQVKSQNNQPKQKRINMKRINKDTIHGIFLVVALLLLWLPVLCVYNKEEIQPAKWILEHGQTVCPRCAASYTFGDPEVHYCPRCGLRLEGVSIETIHH